MSTPLHICRSCKGELVQPVEWRPDERNYWIKLRCPECWTVSAGTYSQRETELLDDEMERANRVCVEWLRRITALNMGIEADTFAEALARDLIAADDFR